MTQCEMCGVLERPENLSGMMCRDRIRCERWRVNRLEILAEFEQHGPTSSWSLYEDWVHRQKLARRLEKRECAVCGGDVPYGTLQRGLCSDECQRKEHSRQVMESRARHAPAKPVKACAVCQTDITDRRGDAKTCSKKCQKKRARQCPSI